MGAIKTKNQHYVPRVYLKRFTDSNGQIHVFNIETQQSFRTSVENVGTERHFYDIPETILENPGPSYDEQAIEKFLSDIESVTASIFRRIDTTLAMGSPTILHHAAISDAIGRSWRFILFSNSLAHAECEIM